MPKNNPSEKHFVVIIYNSFKDPLFQNLVLQYLKTQSAKHQDYYFHLFTFEQKAYKISKSERLRIKKELYDLKIFWKPLSYHSGNFMFFKKIYDFGVALLRVFSIRIRYKTNLMIAFGNVSAGICTILSQIYRIPLLIMAFEPHSAFMVDFGIWKKSSWKYQLLNNLENKAEKRAKYILSSTKAYMDVIIGRGKSNVFYGPSCIDQNIYKFNNDDRLRIRKELQLEDKKVLIYVGKFGGIYYNREIIEFCGALSNLDEKMFFIFLTPNPHPEVIAMLQSEGISEEKYKVHYANSSQEVAAYNSAADMGLSAIPSYPSQKYRSPVKVGEYLLCGIPYFTCEGISEDDLYAEEFNVGVVLPEISGSIAEEAYQKMDLILQEDRDSLRNRCRKVGVDYRGRNNIDEHLEKIFSES